MTKAEPFMTCTQHCEYVNAFPGLRLPTVCVSVAQSIEAIRACGVKCGSSK